MAARIETVEAPFLGLDNDGVPSRIGKNKGRRLENFLPGRAGKVYARGGLQTRTADLAADLGSNAGLAGVWAMGGKALVTRGAWNIPGSTTVKYLSGSSLTTSADVVAAALTDVPIGHGIDAGDIVYGKLGGQRFGAWAGAAAMPTKYTNAPQRQKDITYYLDRLWVLGAVVAGGAPGIDPDETDTLMWSDGLNGAALPDTVAAWQDDASGLINRIVVPKLSRSSNPGLALARTKRSLLVFSRTDVIELLGDTPSSLTVRPILSNIQFEGNFGQGVLEWNDGVMFLASGRLYFYDGTLTNLSEGMEGQWWEDFLGLGAPTPGVWPFLQALDNEHILMSVYQEADDPFPPDVVPTPLFTGILHVPTRSWCTLSFDASVMPNGNPSTLFSLSGEVYGWDGRHVWHLSPLIPRTSGQTSRDKTLAGAQLGIAAYVTTRRSQLGSPPLTTVVQRLIVDYGLVTAGDDGTNGWYVTVTDPAGADVIPRTRLTPVSAATRREIIDAHVEVPSADVTMEFRGSVTHVTSTAEFHAAHLQYEPSQQAATY